MTLTHTSKLFLVIGGAAVALLAATGAALVAAGDRRAGDERGNRAGTGRFVESDDNPLLRPAQAVGEPAPTTPFDLLDGGTASLADYAGRPLVLNFFGSWCPPCVREMPDIEQVHQELGDRVAFVGLAVRDRLSDARSIIDKTGVTYPAGRDPGGDIFSTVGAFAMPSTVFISPDGKIVDVHGGELTAEELRSEIQELLL